MPTTMRRLALALALAAAPLPVAAQGLFAPVATVDERIITGFELDQRKRMMRLFRTPGDLDEAALEALIEERVQIEEARRRELAVTDEELREGMAEFARRADLGVDAFLEVLAGAGVEPETYMDFIRAGLLWRQVVRAEFGDRTVVDPVEIDRAELEPAPRPGLEVSVSEIILPADTPEALARAEGLAGEIAALRSGAAFAAAARRYSASPSRDRGGVIEPLDLSQIPGPIASQLRALDVGEVAGPIQLPNAIAYFQLRSVRETPAAPDDRAIDYAALYLPGGRSPATLAEAAAIEARVDTCDDLYGVARGLPEERLQRDVLRPSAIPADVALELARLDAGEVSTALTRADGATLVFLMLCDRGIRPEPGTATESAGTVTAGTEDPEATEDEDGDDAAPAPSRAALGERLTNRRISRRADIYLADLIADAAIVIE